MYSNSHYQYLRGKTGWQITYSIKISLIIVIIKLRIRSLIFSKNHIDLFNQGQLVSKQCCHNILLFSASISIILGGKKGKKWKEEKEKVGMVGRETFQRISSSLWLDQPPIHKIECALLRTFKKPGSDFKSILILAFLEDYSEETLYLIPALELPKIISMEEDCNF